MKIRIINHGRSFEIDPYEKCGSPSVGRGRTMKEALGDFLISYQKELGLEIDLDEAAQKTERNRRRRELAKR